MCAQLSAFRPRCQYLESVVCCVGYRNYIIIALIVCGSGASFFVRADLVVFTAVVVTYPYPSCLVCGTYILFSKQSKSGHLPNGLLEHGTVHTEGVSFVRPP